MSEREGVRGVELQSACLDYPFHYVGKYEKQTAQNSQLDGWNPLYFRSCLVSICSSRNTRNQRKIAQVAIIGCNISSVMVVKRYGYRLLPSMVSCRLEQTEGIVLASKVLEYRISI